MSSSMRKLGKQLRSFSAAGEGDQKTIFCFTNLRPPSRVLKGIKITTVSLKYGSWSLAILWQHLSGTWFKSVSPELGRGMILLLLLFPDSNLAPNKYPS